MSTVSQGTFYAMTSQGIIAGTTDADATFTLDVRYARVWPTCEAATASARVIMRPYPYDKRYWTVMHPVVGHPSHKA